jgi:hypothetical protein
MCETTLPLLTVKRNKGGGFKCNYGSLLLKSSAAQFQQLLVCM